MMCLVTLAVPESFQIEAVLISFIFRSRLSLYEMAGVMPEIVMPRLSDAMDEGVVLKWLVADGHQVEVGQEFVEIETDKTTVEVESEHAGVLRHGVPEGASIEVGGPIGSIDPVFAGSVVVVPPSQPTAAQPDASGGEYAGAAETVEFASPGRAGGTHASNRERPHSSPTARRLAASLDVSLGDVRGSGPHGRILRADVIAAHESRGRSAGAQILPERRLGVRRVALTRPQRLIAERMSEAKRTAPEFTVARSLDFGPARDFRHDLQARGDQVPSYNDIVVAAVARTLPAHPLLTARFEDGEIVYTDEVNIGVAVATDAVLQAPVIRGAEKLSLGETGRQARRLSHLARVGRLAVDDLMGGTFTVSNLGMFGVDDFTAIVNGGQAAILAVGAVREVPVVTGGSLAVGVQARATLTCDHRIVYGAHAAAFLRDLDTALQAPELFR
ncbi:dihydrolipoamide acetyltransferase family protein [Rhizohabitans arisaemae]|uniref:dihydrolipoamide acetyltransferase family protein n=1 Tax=Rhizohabitans arisaemae TaxID=2720610 RepID=UPI0024B1DE41|nr:dihydrolipoamide acetyltransferase family protein [Rhizohabitans arisaemae]